jgi:hypothetical protein
MAQRNHETPAIAGSEQEHGTGSTIRFARSTLAQRMTVIVSIASLLRPANRIQSAPKGFSRARAGRAHGLDHPSKPPQRDPAGEISIAAADHPFAPLHSFLFLSGPSHHRQFF